MIDLLFQCRTEVKINRKIFISAPLRGTQRRIYEGLYNLQKSLLAARGKRKNKISSRFQLNKNPVIFEVVKVKENTSVIFGEVRVKENALCEKSCQPYCLKKRGVKALHNTKCYSTLWLTFESKYFYEDFKGNSK